jgi:DNA-binding transcriptional ArsR family regulator
VPAEPTLHAVTITADAVALRRELGPTAWVVLEIIVATADDESIVHSSPTKIARLAGLNVDTVLRALRRLRDAGIVSVDETRVGGRFAGTRRSLVIENLHGAATVDVVPLACSPHADSPDTDITVTQRHAAVDPQSVSRRAASTPVVNHSSTPASILSLFEA